MLNFNNATKLNTKVAAFLLVIFATIGNCRPTPFKIDLKYASIKPMLYRENDALIIEFCEKSADGISLKGVFEIYLRETKDDNRKKAKIYSEIKIKENPQGKYKRVFSTDEIDKKNGTRKSLYYHISEDGQIRNDRNSKDIVEIPIIFCVNGKIFLNLTESKISGKSLFDKLTELRIKVIEYIKDKIKNTAKQIADEDIKWKNRMDKLLSAMDENENLASKISNVVLSEIRSSYDFFTTTKKIAGNFKQIN